MFLDCARENEDQLHCPEISLIVSDILYDKIGKFKAS